jgi:hypothetical protein
MRRLLHFINSCFNQPFDYDLTAVDAAFSLDNR